MRQLFWLAATEIHRQTSLRLKFFFAEKALAFLLGLFLCAVLYRGANTPAAIQLLGYGAVLILLLSVCSSWRNRTPPSNLASTALLTALVALVAFGLTGLIHIPTETWLDLAGRSYYREVIQWHQLVQPAPSAFTFSLDAVGTTQAVWVALAALAVCLGTLTLRRSMIMTLLALFVCLAIFQAVLGLLQTALSGPTFLSYWDVPQNRAVGTFINRNHFATWLAMSLPVVLLRTGGAFTFQSNDASSQPGYWQAWWGCAVVLIAAALFASGSRAGTSAAVVVTLMTLGVLATRRMPGKRGLFLLAIVAVTALAVSETVLQRLYLSFGDDAFRESSAARSVMYARAFDAAKQFFPYGAGLGSFSIAFQRFQLPELDGLFIEHVHNDYIQLLFEAGATGVLILAAFAAAAVAAAIGVFRRDVDLHRASPAIGCFLGAAAFAFHSWLDFPAHIPAVAIAATFLFTASIRLSMPELDVARAESAAKVPRNALATAHPIAAKRRVRRSTISAETPPDPALEALFKPRDRQAEIEVARHHPADRVD